MTQKNVVLRYIHPALSVVAGNFLYALAVHLFLIPAGLVTGGTTGIALAANFVWGIPISLFVLVFNVLMLLIGFFVLGKGFALTTLASTFLYPVSLDICERLLGNASLTTDPLLCTLFSGLGIGIALGIGCYTIAFAAYAALLGILFWFPPLEAAFNNRSNHFEVHLELTSSVRLQDFVTVIRRLGLKIDEIEQNPAYVGSGLSVYSISISVSSDMLKKYKTHTEIIEALKTLDYVYHIEEMRG